MNINKQKFIAILTGFISITICIAYLLLITVFDFRAYINDQLSISLNRWRQFITRSIILIYI